MSDSSSARSHQLVEMIGTRILNGEFAPGMKLTEAALAKQLGVNRAPLREALLRLGERQLIERVPFSGMRVARVSTETLAELYEIRELLEARSCFRAAQRITDEDVELLRQTLNESEKRVEALGDADARTLPTIREFHTEIAPISGNKEIQNLLGREVWQFLRAGHQVWRRTRERLQQATKEHWQIFEALAARDAELAEILMKRHIARAKEQMIREASRRSDESDVAS